MFLAVVLLTGVGALADDLTTLDWTTYCDIRVVNTDPISVTVRHSDGISRILFEDLSPELQGKYGYDAAKAEAFEA